MKKAILSAIAVAATLSTAQAAVFNGPSIGLVGGVNISKLEIPANTIKVSTSKTLGAFGVQFLYDMSKANALYFGLGLDALGYTGSLDLGSRSYKLKFSSQLDARLGYNFCGQTIAYVLAGGRLINHEFKAPGESNSETRFATVIGAGVATKIADKVSLGLEYRYSFDRDFDLGAAKLKVRSNQVLAKVSYHF